MFAPKLANSRLNLIRGTQIRNLNTVALSTGSQSNSAEIEHSNIPSPVKKSAYYDIKALFLWVVKAV